MDSNKKWMKVVSYILLTTSLVTETINNPAFANSFDDGASLGQSNKGAISSSISSGSALSELPTFGSTGTTNLQSNYPGSGRDTPSSITNLMSSGTSVQNQACAEGDNSCSARSFVTERYGQAKTNNYRSIAEGMRSTVQGRDPEDVLGLNMPTSGGGTVCTETTTTLPDGTEEKSCLDATLQQTTYFSKIPTTVGHTYTTPTCVEGYELSEDQSTCVKDVYSCPVGGVLNGQECVETIENETPAICPDGTTLNADGFCEREVVSQKSQCDVGETPIETVYALKYASPHKNTVTYATQAWRVTEEGQYAIRVHIGSNSTTGYIDIGYYNVGSIISTSGSTTCNPRLNGNGNNGVKLTSTPDSGSQPSACLYGIKKSSRGYDIMLYRVEYKCSTIEKTPLEDSTTCPSGYEYSTYNKLAFHSGHKNELGSYAAQAWTVNKPANYSISTYIGSNGTSPIYDLGYYDIGDIISTQGHNCTEGILFGNGNWGVKVTSDPGPEKCLYGIKEPDRGYEIMVYEKVEGCNATETNITPATHTYEEASPGCLGGQVTSAGQVVVSEEKLVDGTQTGGVKTCEADTYSCPAGMAMNGNLCEDANRMQYVNNPECVNLGYIPDTETEGFLCRTQELTECSAMPDDCVETGSTCVYTDEIEKSPTFGQCIATEKTYECPVPGETVVSETCGYKPMCIDGNCFEQEAKCPTIPGVNPVQHYDETCQNLTREDIESCPVTYVYGEPDEDGDKPIIGAEVDPETCSWVDEPNCTAAPVTQRTDEEGNSYWPTEANFSCLGDTMELCADLDADTECTLTKEQTEQWSIDGGTPIVTSKHYNCARTITTATDTCTDDFAKMAVSMEASRQAGEYFDVDNLKIFSGEFHRCDRRSAGFAGVSFGSKSCCNISAPDPQSNMDVLGEMKSSIMSQGALSLVDYTIDSGSSYVYDFMMDDSFFQGVSTKLFGTAVDAGSVASQADMLAEQTGDFNVSYGVSYAGVGVAYTGTAAAAGETIAAGGWTGSSAMSLGGGFELQFSPVGFYVFAAMKLYEMYQAALACDDEDYKTSTLSKGKLCYSYGSWCEKKDCGLFGCTCAKYRTGKCCFNSKLARIINEQGRKQLGLNMKDCGGFTVDQLQQLDWSKIDLTEFIADMLDEAQKNLPTASDLQRLNDKIIDNIDSSSSGGVQPIDLGVDGNQKVHN
ncbi:hypothetical protein JCM30760_26110 [Thiomicrorhabdus hydrogeniphila]